MLLNLIHASSLLLELQQFLQSLLHGDQFTLGLRGLVIAVTDVDRAGFLFFGADN